MSDELSSAPVNDENSSAATKRPRIADSVSPTQEQRNSSLNTLPGHTCGHCGKACTAKGKLSEAIQCDFCYVWVHAHCEGITKEQYKIYLTFLVLLQMLHTIVNIITVIAVLSSW